MNDFPRGSNIGLPYVYSKYYIESSEKVKKGNKGVEIENDAFSVLLEHSKSSPWI